MNYRRWGGVGWSEDFFFLGGGVGHMVFSGNGGVICRHQQSIKRIV